jgi:hypothetical protein
MATTRVYVDSVAKKLDSEVSARCLDFYHKHLLGKEAALLGSVAKIQ